MLVRVELGENGNVIRIFRKNKEWLKTPPENIRIMDRAEAVGSIRQEVFERCGVEDFTNLLYYHECERCGRRITWDTFEMNEKQFKGKGGEVSVKNCEALCYDCHQGRPDSVHGNRRWQTAKVKDGPD